MSYKSGNAITTANEDKLNRVNFKTAIARSINNYTNKEMVAFGLNGAWGSGKSSIINLIKEEINKDKYNILEFNPWYYSSRKQLLLDFFEQLSISVGCENTNSNTGAALEKYGKLMKAASLVPALSFLKIFGDISTEFGEFITKEESDSKENLHELKKTLMTEFKNMNKKILIIMDEIDRLEPNEIRELFQLVRALGDFDNIVYFLSYDFDVIKSAFADDKYTAKYTDKYIDKIINIQFDVPKSNKEDFNEYLKKEIEELYSEEIDRIKEENYDDIIEVIYEISFNNLREVKKFLNYFIITYPPIKENVNFGDYLLLSFLRCQEPSYYESIYINKDKLSSTTVKSDETLRNIIKAFEGSKKKSKVLNRLIDSKYCDTYFEYNFRNGNLNAEALLSKEFITIENNLNNYDYLVNFVKNFDEIFMKLDTENSVFYFELLLNKLSVLTETRAVHLRKRESSLQSRAGEEIIRLVNRINDVKIILERLKKIKITEKNEIMPLINIFKEIKKQHKKHNEITDTINSTISKYLDTKEINKEIFKSLESLAQLGYDVKTYITNIFGEDEDFIEVLKFMSDDLSKNEEIPLENGEYEVEFCENYYFYLENIPKENYLNENIIKERINELSDDSKKKNSIILKAFDNRDWEFTENRELAEQREQEEMMYHYK